ncbi:MAG: PqqD family protein [Acholeplasmataceae bacterium]
MENNKYKVKDEYLLKEVAGEYIVVPVGKEAISFQGIINLNETSKLLFENLKEPKTINDLANILTNNYEVDFEIAKNDVVNFIKTLEENNILE